MRVLLVEDDELLGEGTCRGLSLLGYVVDWVKDGQTALRAILSEDFDAIVLDLGLPGRPGMEILRAIRAKKNSTPVLILTANDSVDSRVKGLDTGADDYLVKPFDLSELGARIRALHRRNASAHTPILKHGRITLDPAAHIAYLDGEFLSLSRREFILLQKLIENVGRVLSREQINQSLYKWGEEVDSNALEVHIHNLRRKLGFSLVRTVRGVGYIVEKNHEDVDS